MVKIHTDQKDYEGMRKAGKVAAMILDDIINIIEPGMTTLQIDDFCHKKVLEYNSIPACLDYNSGHSCPFPNTVCTSLNHVVCHGVPNKKDILKSGDIINVDITVIVDGWHGDHSRMYYVGEPSPLAKKLCKITYECMMLGIEQVKPGNTLGDIGYAIQEYAEKNHFSVVRDYCGHGIGKVFHDDPNVLHYGKQGGGMVIKEGMFFTIEPMINAGIHDTEPKNHTKAADIERKIAGWVDDWTVVTKMNKMTGKRALSAQFEHSLGVTSTGFEIFTISPTGRSSPPY